MELMGRSVINKYDSQSIVQSSFYKPDGTPISSTFAPNVLYEKKKKIKSITIGFENLSYAVKTGFFKRENKTIINAITGEFRSGELSAIVGPSGAGKSSLLNILSGYELFGTSGNVFINGSKRDINLFKTNLSFITQDTDLQPFLTISEAMHFSANLKIGNNLSNNEKKRRVKEILESVGIYQIRRSTTGKLSGGEKKRLAIALELVNNPPVLMLDEPTTGLDSSIANQCISLLKKLALEGRNIICTIHQPSGLAIEMFDTLYAIAEGKCIYSGGTRNLVPFLAQLDLNCPEIYNPVDYLMEIATDDYGKQNHRLVEKINNGQNKGYRQISRACFDQIKDAEEVEKNEQNLSVTPSLSLPTLDYVSDFKLSSTKEGSLKSNNKILQKGSTKEYNSAIDVNRCKPKKPIIQIDANKLCKRDNVYATPFYLQTTILLERTFLVLWRDKALTLMRIVIHLLMATLIGILYYGIGDDAGNALNNFRYIFYTLMFLMYTAFSSILVNFPLEFPIVTREHFNRWYSLRAYYIAFTLADIPIQMICTSIFILVSYTLTAQPVDVVRISLFTIISFLTALVAQSIGLTVGASLSIKYGAIFGPFFICPFLAFSGFFLQQNDAQEWLKWIFSISFLKYGLEGSTLAIFGYDRPKMQCNQIYCHFARPKIFLKNIGMENGNYETAVLFLLLVFLGLRIIAFYIMSFRIRIFR